MPSSSARTKSVSASRGIGCSAGELLGLDETVAGGVGEALAGVAEVGAGLLVGDADVGRAAAGLVATPAGPEERVAVSVPVVSGAASAARMAVLSSCSAIVLAAASICCCSGDKAGGDGAGVAVRLLDGVLDGVPDGAGVTE